MYIHHISINSVHNGDFVYEKKAGTIDYLLLYPKTHSMFVIDGKPYTVKDPSIILFSSLTPFKYFSSSNTYIDDYLHFHVDDDAEFKRLLTFPLNTPIKISNNKWISEIMETIYYENNNSTKFSSNINKYLVYMLMLRIAEQWEQLQQADEVNVHYEELLDIRNQIFNHPEKHWQINDLANMIHLSPAYFQVLYKQTFGTTCISDVISARITLSKELLSATDTPVNEIASQLGYNQVYHFIRQFKKNTGLTPGNYRKRT